MLQTCMVTVDGGVVLVHEDHLAGGVQAAGLNALVDVVEGVLGLRHVDRTLPRT